MSTEKGSFERRGLFIAYRELGTINIDEFKQALIADMNALKDIYDIHYVKDARLNFLVTNEYGEELRVRRPTGGTIRFMDTHHYRPACKDYDL
jgi:hypothetical protein